MIQEVYVFDTLPRQAILADLCSEIDAGVAIPITDKIIKIKKDSFQAKTKDGFQK
jgi:hypothetical protein